MGENGRFFDIYDNFLGNVRVKVKVRGLMIWNRGGV